MTIADIIEREFVGKNAPVPVAYTYCGIGLDYNEWGLDERESAQMVLDAASREPPCSHVKFRMSDGSLVIVRPLKPKPTRHFLEGDEWSPEEIAMNPTFIRDADGVRFEITPLNGGPGR